MPENQTSFAPAWQQVKDPINPKYTEHVADCRAQRPAPLLLRFQARCFSEKAANFAPCGAEPRESRVRSAEQQVINPNPVRHKPTEYAGAYRVSLEVGSALQMVSGFVI